MSRSLHVLLIEDSESEAALIVGRLEEGGYKVDAQRLASAEALRKVLARQCCHLVIAGYHPDRLAEAPAALAILRESGHDIPLIVVSDVPGEERAVAMMKAGAQDYVTRSNLGRLAAAAGREVQEARTRRELRQVETDRQRIEEKFRQAQRMESLGREAGTLAHAFNNLLTVITGYAHMGLGQLSSPEKLRESLAQIDEAAKSAAALAERLLVFSRQHSGAHWAQFLTDAPRNLDEDAHITLR